MLISIVLVLILGIFIGIKINEKKEDIHIDSEYSVKDNKVIETLEDEISYIENSEVTDNFKENAKDSFVNIVDFIFYDGEINGVKFEELTDKGKEKVLKLADTVDNKIEEKVPNYKDTISDTTKDAYKEASSLIKKGSTSVDNFMKEKLSDQSYNAITSAKDDLVSYTKDAVETVKEESPKVINKIKTGFSNWFESLQN